MSALGKRIEDISAALERLSPREKYLVGGMAVGFVVFVGLLVSLWISSSLGSLHSRIATKKKNLQTIIDLRQLYDEAKQAQERTRQMLMRAKGLQLMGTLEGLAKNLGINTKDMKMNPKPSSVNAENKVEEQKVELEISKITIDRLVDLLEQIERKSDTFKVRTLSIDKNFQDNTQLDVRFTVSKYEWKQERESAATTGKATKRP